MHPNQENKQQHLLKTELTFMYPGLLKLLARITAFIAYTDSISCTYFIFRFMKQVQSVPEDVFVL